MAFGFIVLKVEYDDRDGHTFIEEIARDGVFAVDHEDVTDVEVIDQSDIRPTVKQVM